MKALVLGGGSIKGSYQAGVIAKVLEAGYQPDIVTGISVGSLNGGFLTARAGAAKKSGGALDWQSIGQELETFWTTKVTGPDALIKKRGALTLGWDILWGKFDGLTSTAPVQRLVRATLAADDLKQSPVRFFAGTVNMDSGSIIYADTTYPDLVSYIIASTAIPLAMPLSIIGNQPFYDGGLRDITPLKQAIMAGATEIVCAVCQPPGIKPNPIKRGNLMKLVDRVLEILTNEILNNDLDRALTVNAAVLNPAAAAPGNAPATKKFIPLLVVRPDKHLTIDLEKFTQTQIRQMVDQGAAEAAAEIDKAKKDPGHPGHAIAKNLTP